MSIALVGFVLLAMSQGDLQGPSRIDAGVVPCPGILALSTGFTVGIRSPCPGQEWAMAFGLSGSDWEGVGTLTPDGGFVVAGFATGGDAWVVKLNASGTALWQKSYGGSGSDTVRDVDATTDGGFVLAGRLGSFGAWLLKLDATGTVILQKTFAGVGSEASSIDETSDGGFIVGGWSDSNGRDYWVLRVDSLGNLLWEATFGSPAEETLTSVQQTVDGGFILGGYAWTDTGGLFGGGKRDAWVIKVDAHGNLEWQKLLGTSGYDGALSILQTSDAGYVLAGNTGSYGSLKRLIMKLDANGEIQWQKTYGGSGDTFTDIQQTPDGGYIAAGRIEMGRKAGSGNPDFGIVKLDANGNIEWQKAYGGAGSDYATSVSVVPGNGYFVTGISSSFGESQDVWALRVDANGGLFGCGTSVAAGSLSPSTGTPRLKGINSVSTLAHPTSAVADGTAIATDLNLAVGTQCAA